MVHCSLLNIALPLFGVLSFTLPTRQSIEFTEQRQKNSTSLERTLVLILHAEVLPFEVWFVSRERELPRKVDIPAGAGEYEVRVPATAKNSA